MYCLNRYLLVVGLHFFCLITTANNYKVFLNETSYNKNLPSNFTRLILKDSNYTYVKKILVGVEMQKYKHLMLMDDDNKKNETQILSEVLIRTGSFDFLENKFNFSIIDLNQNGKFNDKNIDYVCLSGYKTDSIYTHSRITNAYYDVPFSFNCFDDFFSLKYVSPNGDYVEFEKCDKPLKVNCKLITELPEISIKSLENLNKISVTKLLENKKYLYLNFISVACKACKKEMSDVIKLGKEYDSSLLIVNVFSAVDKNFQINNFIAANNLIARVFVSNTTLNYELDVVSYPTAILVNSNGLIIDSKTTPYRTRKILENDSNTFRRN